MDISENTNCVDLFSFVFSHISKILFTQALTLLFGSSGNISFISLWSKANFLPSFVILSILSSVGSTILSLTNSALSLKLSKISFCSGVGFVKIFLYSTSGVGRLSISAV